jgi:biotin/methionine sulfoxide reductase
MTFPQGENPVKTVIPVARMADMLLHPGDPYDFNGETRTYPDIRLVYWCGGNPFHHHQDLNRLGQAFAQPETIIVHEPWWTATAKRADIVLPATTPYEREDIGRAEGDSYLFHMPKMIEPVDEARDDYEIFTALARRMGLEEAFTEGRTGEDWLRHLYNDFVDESSAAGVDVPDFETLREVNWADLPIRGAEFGEIPFAAFREDPNGSPLATPSGKIEIFSDTIDSFDYAEFPGHPYWQPPDEWLGAELATKFPLHMVSPQPGDKLHSQMECALADIPGKRPTAIIIHPDDARQRNIVNGDIVRVFNDRGGCRARAALSSDIRQGVVSLPTGAWFEPGADDTESQGNPNTLTRDLGTSRLGQGCSAHTNLVDIRPLEQS